MARSAVQVTSGKTRALKSDSNDIGRRTGRVRQDELIVTASHRDAGRNSLFGQIRGPVSGGGEGEV